MLSAGLCLRGAVGSILLAGVFCLKWPAFCVGVEVWPVLRGGGMEQGSEFGGLVLIGRLWRVIMSSPSCFVKYGFVLLDLPASGWGTGCCVRNFMSRFGCTADHWL